jgi:hypothetical protein
LKADWMTSSVTSTERNPAAERSPFQAWHFYLLLAMAGATVAVMLSRETHPAALLLISAAVIGAGFVAIGVNKAVAGFFQHAAEDVPLAAHTRQELEREKMLVLRSIKELEFDRAMGKVSDEDFQAISGRLRARAMALMADLDREPAQPAGRPPTPPPANAVRSACPACGTANDRDARFCKQCGSGLTRAVEARA